MVCDHGDVGTEVSALQTWWVAAVTTHPASQDTSAQNHRIHPVGSDLKDHQVQPSIQY